MDKQPWKRKAQVKAKALKRKNACNGEYMAEFNYDEYMAHFSCGGWHYGTNWCDKAVTLKHAADKIRECYSKAQLHIRTRQRSTPDGIAVEWTESDFIDLDLLPVFMLLMGYSLENVFKGIIICGMWLDDPNSVDVDYAELRVPVKNGTQTMGIMKHDLKNLLAAKAIHINFSRKEKYMMDKLNEAIIWAGRYTTSKNYNGNVSIGPQILLATDQFSFQVLDTLYTKAMEELIGLCEKQGDILKNYW